MNCQKAVQSKPRINELAVNGRKVIRGTQVTHMNDAVGSQDIGSCDCCVHAARASGQFGAGSDKLEGVGAFVAMEMMAWPSLSADDTTVLATTWYLSKFVSTV